MNEKQIYSLCEAVADITMIACENKYYSGDTRKDVADFIQWAKEFEETTKDIEWGVNSNEDYIDAIYGFTMTKIK